MWRCWWRHMKSDRLKLELVITRYRSLLLDMKYIEYWVINCIMFVIIKCKNINIYLHNVQLQCFKAVFDIVLCLLLWCILFYTVNNRVLVVLINAKILINKCENININLCNMYKYFSMKLWNIQFNLRNFF